MCNPNPPQERRVRRLLSWATAHLRDCLRGAPAGSADTPYLDALLLLSLASGEPTERLMASLPDELPQSATSRFIGFVEDRCAGTPVSYIRGVKEFYGREFVVTPAVLVPRPDTETLVEAALEVVRAWEGPLPHLHDACTGSGCIAVTLAAEAPTLPVTASDISAAALEIARRNTDRLVGAGRIGLWQSDLLDRLPESCTTRGLAPPRIITANPPYLTSHEYSTMRDAGWPEPELALVAGTDGLDFVRRLGDEAVTLLAPDGYLVVEIGPAQGASGTGVLIGCGFSEVTVRRDLAGRDRVLVARR